MAFKFVLFVASAVFASANAGYTVTSGSDNTYRSPGNLAQVSTQSKTIDTPFSSSSKTDVRVSNPSVYYSAQPAAYAAAAAPIYENHHTKLAYAAVPQATVNYAAAPVTHTQAYYPQQYATYQSYAAPATYPAAQQVYAAPSTGLITKTAYTAPATYQVAQHAPVAYAAPTAFAHTAPATPLVKIAYSPANEVAHFAYSNVNDHINYAW
ncbi:pupal cuticle protein C1B-like [Venturia canescens]|uniref:pupal cuticle protein C1B-like n=1 Tax=Venturia canescens TaxID=32260 RepID=UPI001C9CFF3A|nr:pupal cuticle protein C1B-like [Venturia canescens]